MPRLGYASRVRAFLLAQGGRYSHEPDVYQGMAPVVELTPRQVRAAIMNDRNQGYMSHNGGHDSPATEVWLTEWGVRVAEQTTNSRLAATDMEELVRQGRYGVTVGSWWAYCPQGYPEVVFEVMHWSFEYNNRGALKLACHFQLALPGSAGPVVSRRAELMTELNGLDVVSFWGKVTDGAVRSVTKI
jgi:hypothetical protein